MRTIPYTLLILSRSGYIPLSGSNISDTGLPYFCKHKLTGKIICLRKGYKSYRPMGPLVRVNFND